MQLRCYNSMIASIMQEIPVLYEIRQQLRSEVYNLAIQNKKKLG